MIAVLAATATGGWCQIGYKVTVPDSLKKEVTEFAQINALFNDWRKVFNKFCEESDFKTGITLFASGTRKEFDTIPRLKEITAVWDDPAYSTVAEWSDNGSRTVFLKHMNEINYMVISTFTTPAGELGFFKVEAEKKTAEEKKREQDEYVKPAAEDEVTPPPVQRDETTEIFYWKSGDGSKDDPLVMEALDIVNDPSLHKVATGADSQKKITILHKEENKLKYTIKITEYDDMVIINQRTKPVEEE